MSRVLIPRFYWGGYSACLTAAMLWACSVSSDTNAPDRNFYLEVIAEQKDDSTRTLAEFLKNEIGGRKYTITNRSGQEWPFYKTLRPDETIPRDSLMPPHWFVHNMIPMHPGQRIAINEYLVRIHVLPERDTLPNYNVEIFMMDSAGLSLSGTTGVHYIDSAEFLPPETFRGFLLKSVLRYSFK